MSLKDAWKDKVDGVDDVLAKDINDIAHQVIENEKNISNKVDRENGKGLSSNDFTNEYKNKVDNFKSPVASVAGKTGNVVLDKNDVGLENADNTSDLKKPISDATKKALDKIESDLEGLKSEVTMEVNKFVTEPLQINLLNPAEIEDGVYYSGSTPITGNYSASGLMPIKPDTTYVFANTEVNYWAETSKARCVVFFDENKNAISGANKNYVKSFTSPNNAYFARVSFTLNAREVVVIEGTYPENQNFVYVPYEHRKEANEFFVTDENVKGVSISAINGVVESGKNLFDKTKATLNTYLEKYPELISNTTYFVSDYIPVKSGNKYVVTHTRSWVLYDEKYQKVNADNTEGDNTIIEVVVDGYLRFSNHMSSIDTTQVELGEVPTPFEEYKSVFDDFALLNEKQLKQVEKIGGNVLYGKKWCVVGDSFTNEFSGTFDSDWYFSEGNFIGKSKVYGYLIADRNNMSVQWMANGGRTLATPADGSFTNTFSLSKYTEIDEDVDYITIMLGINDGHHNTAIQGGDDGEDMTGDIPLGTASDTTNATFYGAWNVVLPYLIEHHPKAHIGIIVSNGLDNISYRTATIEMAKKYGIPYIDLNGDERTQAMHRAQNTDLSSTAKSLLLNKYRISSSNTHPNNVAHKVESTIIENFLRSI